MPKRYATSRPSDHNPQAAGVASGRRRAAAETRAQIADDLERDAAQLRQQAEEYADERSPLLKAQADALLDAALRTREGGGQSEPNLSPQRLADACPCGCQPGQPCLCAGRGCCGPCSTCGQTAETDRTGDGS